MMIMKIIMIIIIVMVMMMMAMSIFVMMMGMMKIRKMIIERADGEENWGRGGRRI